MMTHTERSTPDFITPKDQVVHNDFSLSQKENAGGSAAGKATGGRGLDGFRQRVFSPGRLTPQRVKRNRNAFNAFTLTQSQNSPSSNDNSMMSSQSSEVSSDSDMSMETNGARLTRERSVSSAACTTGTATGFLHKLSGKGNGGRRGSGSLLKRRVRSPPSYKNPFSICDAGGEQEFGSQLSRGTSGRVGGQSVCSAHGLQRYRVDFKEVAEIGRGNFSKVVKVVHRLDGCSYAVKKVNQRILSECDMRQVLLEVQSLATVSSHPNIVRYFSSWIESDQLFIQMELCEMTLLASRDGECFSETDVVCTLREISSALQHIHDMGIAHLDVKPDNIYIGDRGEYKLGDFGRAARLDCSTIIQDGDSRYMPAEMLNDDYSCLDKVDTFSLGITALEMITGKPPPESGAQYEAIRAGKLPLLPTISVHLQKLIMGMCSCDARQRPSALELQRHPLIANIE